MQDFDYTVQQAFYIYNILPDLIEGMAGIWLGKNFSGIGDILDIYGITKKKEVLEYLVYMIQVARESYAADRDRQLKTRKK